MNKIKQLNSDINKALGHLESIQDNDHFTDRDRENLVPRIITTAINKIDALRDQLINEFPTHVEEGIYRPLTSQEVVDRVNKACAVSPLQQDEFPTHKGH